MQALYKSFHAKVATQLDEIGMNLDKALADGGVNERQEALKKVENQAHKLAGTAGTFGLDGMTVPARTLEELCRSFNEAQRLPENDQYPRLVSALQNMKDAYTHSKAP